MAAWLRLLPTKRLKSPQNTAKKNSQVEHSQI
jgi:hypothetical protein